MKRTWIRCQYTQLDRLGPRSILVTLLTAQASDKTTECANLSANLYRLNVKQSNPITHEKVSGFKFDISNQHTWDSLGRENCQVTHMNVSLN